jgi:hypothetical protein
MLVGCLVYCIFQAWVILCVPWVLTNGAHTIIGMVYENSATTFTQTLEGGGEWTSHVRVKYIDVVFSFLCGMVCKVYICWGLLVECVVCVMYTMLAIASRCRARWPSLTARQSSGVMFCGFKILLWFLSGWVRFGVKWFSWLRISHRSGAPSILVDEGW